MALSKAAPATPVDNLSRACPATCGARIATILGSGADFRHDARARLFIYELSITVQGRAADTVSHMSQITGSYGFGCPFLASSLLRKGFHEVDFVPSSQPVARCLPLCLGDTHGRTLPLESCGVLRTWDPSQGDHDAENGYDGCLLDRVGSHTRGQFSERCVADLTSFSPYKLLGAPHCVESSNAFLTPPAGTSCADTLRQYDSCSIYQPSRQHALLQASRSCSQAVGVKHSRPGPFEQGCRPSVKGEPSVRRVEAPPPDSGAALGEVRPGSRRSLRLARKRPLSYVLLASGRGHPPWRGCPGSSMAQHAALRFPSTLPDIPDPGQGRGEGFISDFHSSQVAQGTLTSGDNSSSICGAVAPPVVYGPPVAYRPPGPSERGDLSGPGS
ncbi:uncharacterized protein LOC125140302 [Tachysurus fulvidraco]|uniref:uncharacterized protein LOC125140302 n=1 Tax=Tachysurus fulvidraco TaxID=1234273 RepID=UPI001FEF5A44|nr:uncharacterized protein LOC125140302 [Tachysurus fulvidraco]